MKIAPLHFKINYLAIQQRELINYGNKFELEIYVIIIQILLGRHPQMRLRDNYNGRFLLTYSEQRPYFKGFIHTRLILSLSPSPFLRGPIKLNRIFT